MRRLFLTTILLLLAHASTAAEHDSASCCFLNLRGGVGYGLYRDLGASPLTYRGLQLHPALSLSVQRHDWRYEAQLSAAGGGYGLTVGFNYIQAWGGHPVVRLVASRRMHSACPWQLWLGASADNLFDIRYHSSLGNACAGFGNFARLNVETSLEYRLCRWIFHTSLQLNLLSLNLRPGFAYMDNFDQDISSPTANTFDQYHCYPTLLSGAAANLGATYQLPGGNRVGLSYQWVYLTSRTTTAAPHLFQYAHHALLFHLGFRLK